MSRHVEAAATSHVLKVHTRFVSRIRMRYSTNALDRFHHSLTHSYTHTHTEREREREREKRLLRPHFFLLIQLLQLRYRFN
jgi:hypothetical protein